MIMIIMMMNSMMLCVSMMQTYNKPSRIPLEKFQPKQPDFIIIIIPTIIIININIIIIIIVVILNVMIMIILNS